MVGVGGSNPLGRTNKINNLRLFCFSRLLSVPILCPTRCFGFSEGFNILTPILFRDILDWLTCCAVKVLAK